LFVCQQAAQNNCDPQFQKLAKFLRIAKISPIFKEAEVLPRRLQTFGKTNNFVFFFNHLTVIFFKTSLDKITARKQF